MTQKNVALALVALLAVAPLLGCVVPAASIILPLAWSFIVPVDGPPFSEAVLPLFGIVNLFLGSLAILSVWQSRPLGLTIFRWFLSIYSFGALFIWTVFYGSRFIRFFPVKDIYFYAASAELIFPHVIWLVVLLRMPRWIFVEDNQAKQLARPVE
jgi:hypothetical protein